MATIHNPSNFNPTDYEVVDYLDNKRPVYYGQGLPSFEGEVKSWQADMLRTFGADYAKKIHHCIHCGNGSVRWITAVLHIPTSEIVVFGAICTARLGFANKLAFKLAQLQARDEARKVRIAIWNKREKFLAANPAIAAALVSVDSNPVHAKNFFVKDVLSKLDQWGSLSERQVAAVVASIARDLNMVQIKAAEALEVKGDAPTGRQTVTGVVLSLKVQDSDFGPVTKMLVKLENGSRVWVTAPSKASIERNMTITFAATFTVSKDDKSFAFGSRPSLVSVAAA